MEIKLETYLKDLKAMLLEMGGGVEKGLELVTRILRERSATSGLQAVFVEEKIINDYQMRVDEKCLKLLARQAPKASDLRLILSILRANADLERMGDLNCNIARSINDLFKAGYFQFTDEVSQLADQVRNMIRTALDAMTRHDVERAYEVLGLDDAIDKWRDNLVGLVKEQIKDNPDAVDSLLQVFLIIRNLERHADHATNIAEDVIFAVSGRDIRHGSVKGFET